jgi:hypothetical protein
LISVRGEKEEITKIQFMTDLLYEGVITILRDKHPSPLMN